MNVPEEGKMQSSLYDAAGHRRSPVTMPGFHEGRTPRNKGRRYPADPPTVEEIVAVMRAAGDGADSARLRAFIVILWRAGRIGEALDLSETDLDVSRGAVLVRRGKGGSRREVACVGARVAVVGRSGWIGGRGLSRSRGWPCAASCRSARCSV
jgi:integrase